MCRDAYAVVVFLSSAYFNSPACLTELISVFYHREDRNQLTVFFAPADDDSFEYKHVETFIDFLREKNVPESHIIRNEKKLLLFIKHHVFQCYVPGDNLENGQENWSEDCLLAPSYAERMTLGGSSMANPKNVSDRQRLLEYHKKFSEEVHSLTRYLRLPSEKQLEQSVFVDYGGKWNVESGSIRIGQRYTELLYKYMCVRACVYVCVSVYVT